MIYLGDLLGVVAEIGNLYVLYAVKFCSEDLQLDHCEGQNHPAAGEHPNRWIIGSARGTRKGTPQPYLEILH